MTTEPTEPPSVIGLPRVRHGKNDVWRCRVCGYMPNVDSRSKFCVSCGRDFYGNPGTIPTDVGDPRPQVYKVGYVEEVEDGT